MTMSHEWMHGYSDGKAGRWWPSTGSPKQIEDYNLGYSAGEEDREDEGLCERCEGSIERRMSNQRVVVFHNAAAHDDCGGVLIYLEPVGRKAEDDLAAYPGYTQCKMFEPEWLESLGYEAAPDNIAVLLEP